MRVLICDQESEMLERVARAFEVDVATSKTTCIDLMRANPFDIVVASERLIDGSGLELLSHIATRWPDTLRVLAIEPKRLRSLGGAKLAPFRLNATIRYPIDEDELEQVLIELYNLLGEEDEPNVVEEPPRTVRPAPVHTPAHAVARPAVSAAAARPANGSAGTGAGGKTSEHGHRPSAAGHAAASPPDKAKFVKLPPNHRSTTPSSKPKRAVSPFSDEVHLPARRQMGNYVPLGSPEDEQPRIVERRFDQTTSPIAARALRAREDATRPRTSSEKAKDLTGNLGRTLKRLLKR